MITPSFGLTATERVLPRLALDFTTASLDARVTLTRSANTATRVNASGLVEIVNADLPRFDFDPITLACKGLLIEETRQNVCWYSENFSAWNTSGSVSVTANSTIAPDGNQTADTIARTAGQSDAVLLAQTFTGDGVKAVSVWVKKGTSPASLIALLDATASAYRLWVDVTWSGNTPVLAFTSGSLLKSTEYANDWWRLEFATTAVTAANTNRIYIYPGRAGSVNGDNVIVWGAQAENGAFCTSYIPNSTSSSTTRNADVATMTGTNFSDWFNATEGTLACAYRPMAITAATQSFCTMSDGTTNEMIQLLQSSTNAAYAVKVGNVFQTLLTPTPGVSANTEYLLVGSYKADKFAAAKNGSSLQTDTSGTIPTVDQLRIGAFGTGGGQCNGHISKINYWNLSLTNQEVLAFSK